MTLTSRSRTVNEPHIWAHRLLAHLTMMRGVLLGWCHSLPDERTHIYSLTLCA